MHTSHAMQAGGISHVCTYTHAHKTTNTHARDSPTQSRPSGRPCANCCTHALAAAGCETVTRQRYPSLRHFCTCVHYPLLSRHVYRPTVCSLFLHASTDTFTVHVVSICACLCAGGVRRHVCLHVLRVVVAFRLWAASTTQARGSTGVGDLYIENILAELDAPHEFYHDAAANAMYV